jgi:hypothetical protein
MALTDQEIRELILETVRLEGGYVNDPDDPGKETKFGISRKSYPDLDIANLTEDQAIDIYRRDYWEPVVIPTDPPRVQWKVFDIGVNQGPAYAKAYRKNVDYLTDQWAMLHGLCAWQAKRYAGLVVANPKLIKYIYGWIIRAMRV